MKSLLLGLALLGLAVDARVPPLELPDQNGVVHPLDGSLRAIVFSRDMAAGQVVKDAIAKAGPTLFERNRSVYVVDLAGMSSFVRRWFALPGLRRKPYRILVDEDGTRTADFPVVEGRPTVLVLDDLRVSRVEEPASADALLAILEPAPR
ncbi:MAG TPA: hypothetical protein VMR86_07410 [Myxococcota bacterium]|nr:hypothetical protein [Myxococcota bacterium]